MEYLNTKYEGPGMFLVAACFLDNQIYNKAIEQGITDDHFTMIELEMWSLIKKFASAGAPYDINTLNGHVKPKMIEQITAMWNVMLSPLHEGITAINALKNNLNRKKTMKIISKHVSLLDNGDPQPVVADMINELSVIQEDTMVYEKVDVRSAILKDLHKETTISTGFSELNWLTKGVEGGAFWVIGGSTSHGKSMFVLNICDNVARCSCPVTIFSTEMGDKPIVKRFASMRCGLNPSIRELDRDQEDEFMESVDQVLKLPIQIVRTNNLAEIKSVIQRKREGLYVVDYLQMIYPPYRSRDDSDVKRLGSIAHELEMLSKQYDCCIMATSQYSRPRDGAAPDIHRFRGSGEIEEACDIGVLMYYPFQDADHEKRKALEAENKHNIININVQKNRLHGLIGMFRVYFERQRCLMKEIRGD